MSFTVNLHLFRLGIEKLGKCLLHYVNMALTFVYIVHKGNSSGIYVCVCVYIYIYIYILTVQPATAIHKPPLIPKLRASIPKP